MMPSWYERLPSSPDSDARIYAIGDLHGHYRELRGLYGKLLSDGLQPARDRIIFLGDYVDSGPDAPLVIQQMMEWQRRYPHWRFLLGNHEDMFLKARNGWTRGDQRAMDHWWFNGGSATWQAYSGPEASVETMDDPFAKVPQEHFDWIASLQRLVESDRYLFVHAGLRPGVPVVENDPDDLVWIRETFIHSQDDWGKVVIYGHTGVKEPLVMANKICINTMPRNSGALTAVCLDDSGHEAPRFIIQPAFV